MNLLDADASTVAEKIRSREITATQAVETYITHLQRVNPLLNCLVEDRFEAARREAASADEALRSGTASGSLFGVPFSIKECFHVEGMRTTGGLSHRKDMLIHVDAAVVSKLKAEGAIILGKTNTPTLCFCQESDNKLFGRTNNPFDRSRTAGGSSGGEGALIAVGGAAAGLGADVGGSIRFPSHFNGVVGFKSGNRQVPQQGNFPYIDQPLQERMLGIGPVVKSVRDAKRIYQIISHTKVEEKDLSSVTIGVLPRVIGYPLSEVTEAVLQQIKELLRSDYSVQEAVPPYFNESSRMWQEMMSADGGNGIAKIAFGDRNARIYGEYFKELLSGKAELHRYMTWALIGMKWFKPSKARMKEIADLLRHGDELLESYLENRILILPVYHQAAPKHGELYRELFSIRKTFLRYMPYIAYPNVWGLPSLTLPVGIDENGMPIGIQLVSKNGNEDLLFQLGEILEKKTRGYKRCNGYDS
ncbi:MAG TPA: amidase [Bacillales bacterium]|nr:amidase [Bacillales bacterium]